MGEGLHGNHGYETDRRGKVIPSEKGRDFFMFMKVLFVKQLYLFLTTFKLFIKYSEYMCKLCMP